MNAKYLGRRVWLPLLWPLFEGLAGEERVLSDKDVAQLVHVHASRSGSPELSEQEIAKLTRTVTGLDVDEAVTLIAGLPRGRRRRAAAPSTFPL